jgi:hypothetical protein
MGTSFPEILPEIAVKASDKIGDEALPTCIRAGVRSFRRFARRIRYFVRCSERRTGSGRLLCMGLFSIFCRPAKESRARAVAGCDLKKDYTAPV